MKTRMAVLALSAALSVWPVTSSAQVPSPSTATVPDDAAKRLALSNRFVALIQTDQMSATLSQLMTSLTAGRPGMTAAQSAGLQRASTRMMAEMLPRMFEIAAPIYADIFTLEELQALVGFYESDVGQSMMRKSAEAGPRMSAAIMAVMPELMGDMAGIFCDEMNCTADERTRVKAAMAGNGAS